MGCVVFLFPCVVYWIIGGELPGVCVDPSPGPVEEQRHSDTPNYHMTILSQCILYVKLTVYCVYTTV